MRARGVRLAALLLILAAAAMAAGCGSDSDEQPEKKQAASTESSTAASLESSETSPAASEPTAAVEATAAPVTPAATAAPAPAPAPAPVPTPAPSTPAAAPKPKLGPTDAKVSWAYLKDMYQKDGFWYVVVDYIQVVGPEETLHFVNENPKLRTFPLADGAKLYLLKNPGNPDYKLVGVAQFKAFENGSGDEVVEVTPKSGYAVKLKEWWAP